MRLEQRTRDICDLKFVFLQDLLRLCELIGSKIHDVFAPHDTQFYPLHSKILRSNMTGVIEIRGDLVRDYRNLEWRFPELRKTPHNAQRCYRSGPHQECPAGVDAHG